ncbi:MAG TPA: TIGR00730 family Rossman fold protein [Xanthobacteraceae bacterium]|nr:TIGR00730 family Rossman fold protein [Xanthobacteraceae bacterium]
MSKINALCVYCGSSPGADPAFAAAAQAFGKILGENRIRLIYGGGSVGLMGIVAQAVLDHGGEVTGIIPEFLTKREQPSRLSQELIVTPDMHTRKRLMFERADGFIALPGGLGTLEEVVEQLTWAQLGRHKKPILFANINGYWEPLLALIEHMRAVKFLRSAADVEFLVAKRVEEIVPKLHEAARKVAEAEGAMAVPAERLG